MAKQDRYDEDGNPFGLPEKRGLYFYVRGIARGERKHPRPRAAAKGGWSWLLWLTLVIAGLAILRTLLGF